MKNRNLHLNTRVNFIISYIGIVCIILVISFSSMAQKSTVVSTGNGDFFFPLTWSCMCIPQQTDSIVINHDVVLNNDWALTTGSITINPGGSLKKNAVPVRNFMLSGGTITNYGTFLVDHLLVTGGLINNFDTLDVTGAMYNDGIFNNSGIVPDLDSLYNVGIMTNLSGGSINNIYFTNADSYSNAGEHYSSFFMNEGTLNNSYFIAADYLSNTGTFTNDDLVYIDVDIQNFEIFNNNLNGYIDIFNDFLNADTVNNDAVFTNNGLVFTNAAWANIDTIKGTTGGGFCVGGTSENYGIMTGTFDFCDILYPPGNLDVNTGTIDSTITYCTLPVCWSSVATNGNLPEIKFYPNPASDVINIQNATAGTIVTLFDITGRTAATGVCDEDGSYCMKVGELASGLYMIIFRGEDQQIQSGKLIIE